MTADDDSIDMTTRLCHGAVWAIVCLAAGLACGADIGEAALFGLLPGFVFGALLGPYVIEIVLQWGWWP